LLRNPTETSLLVNTREPPRAQCGAWFNPLAVGSVSNPMCYCKSGRTDLALALDL